MLHEFRESVCLGALNGGMTVQNVLFMLHTVFYADFPAFAAVPGLGSVMAKRELQTAITAAKVNNVPTPNRCQIHPPSGAERIAIR